MEDYNATDEIIEMAKEILAKEDNPFLTSEQRELIERILKELDTNDIQI